jgi:hypothetical protein
MQVLVPLYARDRWYKPSRIVAFVPVEVLRRNPFASDNNMYDSSIYEVAAYCSKEVREKLAYIGIHIEGPILPNPVPSHKWDSPSDIMWVPGYNAPGVKTEFCPGQKSNEKSGLRLLRGVHIAQKLLWHAYAGTKSLLEKLRLNVVVLIVGIMHTTSLWILTTKIQLKKGLAFLRKCKNLKRNY